MGGGVRRKKKEIKGWKNTSKNRKNVRKKIVTCGIHETTLMSI